MGLLRHRSLGRQVIFYIVIGVVQVMVDWLCFVALTAWGMPVAPANVIARVLAAVLGFSVNGTITFQSRLKAVLLVRFIIVWIPLTLANTLAVSALGVLGGLHFAWLVKPVIDGLTAVLGFLVARHWVFRIRHQNSARSKDAAPHTEEG